MSAAGAGHIDIDVVYEGPDLGRVAGMTGLSTEAVIAAHTGTPWRVEYCGFAPGFAYLTGGDSRLVVPRLDTPRPEVPCGAVGLAGEYSGIYPRRSPGGWNLIGRTGAVLWDLDRDPPALLRPGMTVRFRAVREYADLGGTAPAGGLRSPVAGAASPGDPRAGHRSEPGEAVAVGPTITVLAPGMLCLVQDLGRDGYVDVGVSPSGAADRGAAIRANRLVGNPDGAAVLELLLGGAELRVEQAATLALTGASAALSSANPDEQDAAALEMDRALALPAGTTLRLGRPKHGLRTYVAVRGGIDVAPVLSSRSTDTLSGLGPPPVTAGMRLPIGPAPQVGPSRVPEDTGAHLPARAAGAADHDGVRINAGTYRGDVPAAAAADHDGARTVIRDSRTETSRTAPSEKRDGIAVLDAGSGPQRHWFDAEAVALLEAQAWAVSPRSNRVGVRLQGAPLPRVVGEEMRIQPLTRGAIQVPPSGEPIIFLSDYPVTGGYPVIAVLADESVDRIAQARPGATVRIRLRP